MLLNGVLSKQLLSESHNSKVLKVESGQEASGRRLYVALTLLKPLDTLGLAVGGVARCLPFSGGLVQLPEAGRVV